MTAPRERPILMAGEAVRAILEGRKTQTRRPIVPQPEHLQYHTYRGKVLYDGEHRLFWWREKWWDLMGEMQEELPAFCPFGAPGDRLWVRETWCRASSDDAYPGDGRPIKDDYWYYYAATEWDIEHEEHGHRSNGQPRSPWSPSIHMPRWACRLVLDVVEVRVQRLQDITEEGAEAEGITIDDVIRAKVPTRRDAYRYLWDELYGKRFPWDSNPWVWAITFRRIEGAA